MNSVTLRRLAPHIALLAALLTLAACHRRLPREVALADSLLSTRPDSALALLRGVAGEVEGCSRSDRMRYALLCAEAQNKAYEDFTTDSVVRRVAEYYEQYGTAHERMRASYVLAAAYRDLDRPLDEQRCLNQAIDLADTAAADCDHALLARIYGQLGKLYIHIISQRLTKDILERGVYHARRANDRLAGADYLHYIGLCYYNMHMPDSAIFYYKQSKKIYRQYADTLRAAYVSLSLAEAYTIKKNYSVAFRLIREYEKESGEVQPDFSVRFEKGGGAYYATKGQYYLGISEADSALVYFYRERFCGDKSYLYSSYWDLAEAYKLKGETDSVLMYKGLYLEHILECQKDTSHLHIQDLQVFYDARRKQAELKRRHTPAMSGSWTYMMIVALLLLLGVAAGFIRILHHRKMKRKLIRLYQEAKEELQRLEASRPDFSEEGNALTIRQLERKIAELLQHKMPSESSLEDVGLLREQIRAALDGDTVRRLHEYARTGKKDKVPYSEDWAELARQVERHAAGFRRTVDYSLVPLKDNERRLCHLLLCGFAPSEMARLLNCSPQNVSSMRSRLGLKVFGRDMKAREFDRHFIAATVIKLQ